jgi:predicted peptidase
MNRRLAITGLVILAFTFAMLTSNAQVSDPSRVHEIAEHFEERTFRYTAGKFQDAEIKYRLHTPTRIRYGRKYPLVVHLHGLGEAGTDNTLSLLHFHSILPVLVGPESEDFFMLVVQCPPETPAWNFTAAKDGTLDVLMAVMEHVIAENPINKKRLTVTGVSSGGTGVWTLLTKYPDIFAGAVPTASSAPSHLPLATLKQTPIWTFVTKNDPMIHLESVQTATRMVNNSGGAMAITEWDVRDHNTWRHAMDDHDCLRWMLEQKKGSWFSPPPGIAVHKPHSFLPLFFKYILPLTIIAITITLSLGTIGKWASDAWQSFRERF